MVTSMPAILIPASEIRPDHVLADQWRVIKVSSPKPSAPFVSVFFADRSPLMFAKSALVTVSS